MENAHLTKAHEHARNAASATYGTSIAAAGEAHALAAVSFHEAARDTHDAEALRILSLLEDHHQKLARLIKEPPRKKERSSESTSQDNESTSTTATPPKASSSRATSPPSKASSPTRAPSRRRLPHSSIASNLAEKRGITGARRGTPTSSPVSVTNALAARNDRQATPVRDLLEQQSRKADEASRKKEDASASREKETPRPRQDAPPSGDGFRRFYSTFGDVINAISAPLAFTALPLLGTESPSATDTPPAPQSPPEPKPKKSASKPAPTSIDASRTLKSSEPDLASLISKPALHALRDTQAGPLGPFARNESFYLVPTSGGTASYATIARDPAHAHHAAQDPHLDPIAEGDTIGRGGSGSGAGLRGSSHEEFVDARESIGPPSPTKPRRHGGAHASNSSTKGTSAGVTTAVSIRAGRGTGLKTMEELVLENETLRAAMDKMTKRINMWEQTSQKQFSALAMSARALQGGSAGGGVGMGMGMAGLGKQVSDPGVLARALASPPPVPPIPSQYQSEGQKGSSSSRDKGQDKEKEAAASRVKELEAQIQRLQSQLASLESSNKELVQENAKQAKTIGRYREQWERLKDGARKKEAERRERARAQAAESESNGNGKESDVGERKDNGKDSEAVEDVDADASTVADAEDEAGAAFGKA